MKNVMIKNWFKKLWMLSTFACIAWVAGAQIVIHVSVLPPYYTHFTDYSSHPQQIMLLVTNTSDKGKDIQLRGSITGDNGVEISVEKNFKNPTPLHVDAGATRTLNGNDINSLFDFNQLVYTGISRDKLMLQGNLPEGNYQVCVRAFDYNTNVPLSEDQPTGCSNTFPVSSVEPPIILKPSDGDALPVAGGQNFVITWSTPAGALPTTQYTVSIAEILDNKSPQVAMMSATNPLFYQATVTGTNVLLYNAAMPALTQGRRYAMMVTAKDPTNKITFRNNGQSEVIGFVYGDEAGNLPPDNGNVASSVVCGCAVPQPANVKPSTSISPGGVITAGNFSITVLSVFKNSNNTLSGTGKVNLPVANSSFIPVGVNFNNIQINSSNQLISGVINAQVKNDVNFLPTVPSPNPSLIPFTQADITNLSTYIDNNVSNTVSQLKSIGANTVFQLPIGLDKSLAGSPVTIEVTALTITPTQAVMDAATVINTPDDNVVSRIALGAKNICVNPADLCGDAKLFLAEDVNLPSLNLTLKGAANPGGGTYVVFDKGGFKNMQIVGAIALPQSVVVQKSDGVSPVTAQITATTDQGWSDWIASVSLPDFLLSGAPDLKFSVPNAFYDHSDFKNPNGLPGVFHSSDPNETDINTSAATWHGLFIPAVSLSLPPVISTGSNLTIAGSNFIYDSHGFTGLVSAVNPLAIGDGSLGGWYASIDAVNIEIFKSGFKSGAMQGKLVLPPSGSNINDPSNQLNYNCLLTIPQGGKTQFVFSVQPKAGLKFKEMYMVLNLDNSSNIQVTYNAGSTPVASAELNGSLTVDTKQFGIAAGAASMLMPSVQFQHFKLMTTAPYIDGGIQIGFNGANNGQNAYYGNTTQDWAVNTTADFGPRDVVSEEDTYRQPGYNPPLANFSVGGFTAELSSVTPSVTGNLFGLDFNVNLSLLGSDLSWGCKANTVFTLGANLSYQNGRIICTGAGTKLKDLSFDASAKLGPVGLSGGAKYFNNAALGEGFVGVVDVNVIGVLNLAMRVRFGYKPDNGGYNYFDLNALVDFGEAGIQMFNPVYLYGFGGGIAFNENIQVSNPKIGGQAKLDDMKNGNVDQLLGYSPGGVTFVPDKGKFVLQATVLFGLVPRTTLDCDATLTAVIDYQHGGLAKLNFNGGARVMAQPGQYGPAGHDFAVGAGSINVDYDFVNNVFDLSSEVDMGVPNIGHQDEMAAHATFDIHIDKKDFWVYCGTLADRNTIGLLKIPVMHPDWVFTGTSYFEMGSKIDDLPPLPPSVGGVDISSLSGQVATDPNRADMARNHTGIIMGATADFNWTQPYLIFYGKLHAGLGFDVTLQQLSGSCATTSGANGWYAKGQAYMGATADIGIDVDLLFIHGRFSVLSAGVAAVLQAQLPNPTWVKGDLFGQYSILDGAVSGNMHYQFEIGNKLTGCSGSPSDVVGGVKLIGDISPGDGSQQVEISAVPNITFNIKRKQFDFTELKDDGTKLVHHFLFDNSCLTYTINYQQVNFINQDEYTVYYTPTTSQGLPKLFTPNTSYNITVQAKVKQLDDFGNFTGFVQNPNGVGDYVETKTTTFTTNSGLTQISDYLLAFSFPQHSDQAVFYNDAKTGGPYGLGDQFIQTKTVIQPQDFVFAKGIDPNYLDPKYTFVLYKNGQYTGLSELAKQDGLNYYMDPDAYNFNGWFQFDPASNYRVELWMNLGINQPSGGSGGGGGGGGGGTTPIKPGGRSIMIATPGATIGSTLAIQNRYIDYFNNSNKQTLGDIKKFDASLNDKATTITVKDKLAADLQNITQGAHLLTAIEFTTSKYAAPGDKIGGMRIHEIYWNGYGIKISRDYTQLQNLWNLAIISAYDGRTKPGGTMYVPDALNYIAFESDEQFSRADVNAITSDQMFLPSVPNYFVNSKPAYLNTNSDLTVSTLTYRGLLTNDKAIQFIAEVCGVPTNWVQGNIVGTDGAGSFKSYANWGSDGSSFGKQINLGPVTPIAPPWSVVNYPWMPSYFFQWYPSIYVTNVFTQSSYHRIYRASNTYLPLSVSH